VVLVACDRSVGYHVSFTSELLQFHFEEFVQHKLSGVLVQVSGTAGSISFVLMVNKQGQTRLASYYEVNFQKQSRQ
jgi:hypothetical protein